jgi:flavin reductase (DIM6/NTAB) family NADH-FMN oxidoreductase RutF
MALSQAGTIEADHFRHGMAQLPGGVTALAVQTEDGGSRGLTVSAFASLSLEPPLVMAAIDNGAKTLSLLTVGTAFSINVLRADAVEEALRFAGRHEDKLAGLRRHARGGLWLERCVAWIDCRVHARYPGGDHTIVVGEVIEIEVAGGPPLVYHHRNFGTFAAAS